MTLERASDLVLKLRETDPIAAVDLFCHFDDVFHLSERDKIHQFAELCGYGLASEVQL